MARKISHTIRFTAEQLEWLDGQDETNSVILRTLVQEAMEQDN